MSFIVFFLLSLSTCSIINLSNYPHPLPNDENVNYVAILGTNDIHGAFFPQIVNNTKLGFSFSYGGLEYLGRYVSILRKEWKDKFLWFDGGDIFQGGIESKLSHGNIMTDFFNVMKVDASTIGNHEWDFGQEFLKKQMKRAKFPYLVSNILNTTTNEREFMPNQIKSKIFTLGDIKIGVIGITTVNTVRTTSGDLTSVKFLDYIDIITKEAKEMRKKTNAVILLSHVGMKCLNDGEAKMELKMRTKYTSQKQCEDNEEIYILLNALPKHTVDAVIAAHKHDVTHHWINGTPVISSLNNGVYANVLYFPFDKKTKQLIRKEIQTEGPLPVCEKIFSKTKRCMPLTQDEVYTAGELVEFKFHNKKMKKEKRLYKLSSSLWPEYFSYVNTVITKTNDILNVSKNNESSLGNLFCDIVKRRTSADISILNAGSFRNTWNPGYISRASIFGMAPFDSKIVSVEMTGSEIKKMLAQIQSGAYAFYPSSGLKMVVTTKPKKQLLSAKLYDGIKEKEINDDMTYVVGTIDFDIPFGGDDFRKVTEWYSPRNLKEYGILREEVADYLLYVDSIESKQFYRNDKKRLTIVKNKIFMIINQRTEFEELLLSRIK